MSHRTIVGLKLTHDGAIAVIDGDTLSLVVEVEKYANRARYSPLDSSTLLNQLCSSGGFDLENADVTCVDGWHKRGEANATVPFSSRVGERIVVAPYMPEGSDSALAPLRSRGPLGAGGKTVEYRSYTHAIGHISAAYVTSPFASIGQPAMALIWDGGMLPHLFSVDPSRDRIIESRGPILPFPGNLFGEFCGLLDPFESRRHGAPKDDQDEVRRQLEVAGKAMAYAALGSNDPELLDLMSDTLDAVDPLALDAPWRLLERIRRTRAGLAATSADLIASLQTALARRLVDAVSTRLRDESVGSPINLCLGGGCALNIKWNSALRRSGPFEVWVPPFPNDSGAAIGAASAEFMRAGGVALRWDVYSGPALGPDESGWVRVEMGARGLAKFLHEAQVPVGLIQGRAELGPRALGNRSIIASAANPKMLEVLNGIKGRESYRPVAPVCAEEMATQIFDPGTPDPFMLFEHGVKSEWRARIPATIHLDGTARLQTVSHGQNPFLWALLRAHYELTGTPVLCNTSANLQGSGFFPDLASAQDSGVLDFIFSDGYLYIAPAGARIAAEFLGVENAPK